MAHLGHHLQTPGKFGQRMSEKNVEDALKERERLKKSGLSEDKQHSKLLELSENQEVDLWANLEYKVL